MSATEMSSTIEMRALPNTVTFGFVKALAAELSRGQVDLPSVPEVVARLQRALSDENASNETVVLVVSSEPMLAAKLMNMANSAALNPSERKIADLRTAVARVGFNIVRSAALSFAVEQLRRSADFQHLTPQLDALSKDTDLVTLGMGLEDRDLLEHMFTMCTTAPCGARVAPQTVADDLDQVGASLTEAVRAIQAKAPGAYIVLVGYPQITPDSGHCAALPPLDGDGLALAGTVIAQLNAAIQSSARETGSAYLDTGALSAGHTLCSSSPWVTGRKGEPGTSVAFRGATDTKFNDATALATLIRTR